MSEPIRPGDLVVIVKPKDCCGYSGSLGEIHVVDQERDRTPFAICSHCGSRVEHSAETTVRLVGADYIKRHRLKRIPPLSELEGERRDEKLTEPA